MAQCYAPFDKKTWRHVLPMCDLNANVNTKMSVIQAEIVGHSDLYCVLYD
jgi:hypothetical protein